MPANKNQHFVPRCYLRAFCNVDNEKAIALFNVKRKLFIPNAPLRKQCTKNYFYGNDFRLEENIQKVEREYSMVLKKVRENGYILQKSDAVFLIKFWLFQYFRTDAAAQQLVDIASEFADLMELPEEENEFDQRKATLEHLQMFQEQRYHMNDLKVRLFKNNSVNAFITSDDPAIFANKWYQMDPRPNRRLFGGGLKSAGAIILLPLTPRILFIAFDGDVYSIPHVNGWVKNKSAKDVSAINQHQHLNYHKNLYCVDQPNSNIAQLEIERSLNKRPSPKYKTDFMVEHDAIDENREVVAILEDGKHYVQATEEEAKKVGESLFRNRRVRPVLDSWPTALKPRRKGIVCSNGSYGGYLRKLHAQISVTKEPDLVFWEEPASYRDYAKKR